MDSEVEGVQTMVISIGDAYAGTSATLICLSSDWAPVRSRVYSVCFQ